MAESYRNIVILTGAGISAESGLATFRSSNGLWNNHRVEDVASVEGFERNPELVHDFYNNLKTEIQTARPNAAHLAITRLQREYPAAVSVITQNVDTLHEKAGSKEVWHIHGQINQAVCLNCSRIMESWSDVTTETACPHCSVSGMMKPNIVFSEKTCFTWIKSTACLRNAICLSQSALPALSIRRRLLCRLPKLTGLKPGNSPSNPPQIITILTIISTDRPEKPFRLL